jgi:DNA primase
MIESVLEHYGATINRSSGSFAMRCPFHDDRHASGSVDLNKDLYNCFTCGVSGDAISIVMRQEGISFVEAKRIVEELTDGSGGEIRRSPAGEPDGYLLPGKSRRKSGRRHTIPAWRRGPTPSGS